MYLMFDKVWNGEYNEYAVESRIIGEKPYIGYIKLNIHAER